MLEGLAVALKEGFLLFVGKGHHERHAGVAQARTEEMRRGHHAIQDDLGGAPVDFGLLAGFERQGDEDWPLLALELAHDVADGRLGPREAVLAGLRQSRDFVMLSASEASRPNVQGGSSLRLRATKLAICPPRIGL